VEGAAVETGDGEVVQLGMVSARGVRQAGRRSGPEKGVGQSRRIDGEPMGGRLAEVREGRERV